MKSGPKKGQARTSKFAKFGPFDQSTAAWYGEAFTNDPEAFDFAEAWVTLGDPQSSLGALYRETLNELGKKRAGEIIRGFAENLEKETGRYIAEICRTGCTFRLNHLASAIDALRNTKMPRDQVRYVMLNAAMRINKDFWKKPPPRELPFTYNEFRAKYCPSVSKATIYNAKNDLNAAWLDDWGTV